MDALSFFRALYRNCEQGVISIMTLPDKRIEHIPAEEIEETVHRLTKYGKSNNAYFGIGLRREGVATHLRGSASDINCFPCLFADIDVAGEAHRQTALPASKEEALSYLHGLREQPNIVVDSGHGLQAYWLFDKPIYVNGETERRYITDLLFGFGRYIQEEGAKRGWELDSVFDIARMLRAPGSINHKNGQRRDCKVIETSEKRYSVKDFDPYKRHIPVREEMPDFDTDNIGDSSRIFEKCVFLRHCRDNAASLSEPEWHSAICNLALVSDGETAVHEISRPYNGYSREETESRRIRALKEQKPHTCRYIRECLGFACPDKGCGVKALVAHAVLSMDERLAKYMDADITADEALTEKSLFLMGYAKEHQPAEYARFKLRLKPLGIGVRDFERAMKSAVKQKTDVYNGAENKALLLEGIELADAVVPANWLVSIEQGLQKLVYLNGFPTMVSVSSAPVLITRRLENIDTGLEKVELSFFRNGRWKNVFAPRSAIFNKSSIIRYPYANLIFILDSADNNISTFCFRH